MTVRCAAALAAVATMLAASPAAAETFEVTTTADTPRCSVQIGCSLRGAVSLSNRTREADRIVVPAGVYALTLGTIDSFGDATIQGAGARSTIVVASGARAFVVRGSGVPDGEATLAGMTLRGGVPPGDDGYPPYGGNVLVANARVTLRHIRLTGGQASSGGGLANWAGTVLIDRSLIDGNRALTGGGDGGGIANVGFADADLGFIPAGLTVRNTTITGNAARLGGAVSQWTGDDNRMTFEHVTVAANEAGDRGGGFIGDDPREPDGVVRVQSSVIAGNTPANCGLRPTDAGGNVESGADCGFALHDVDPLLSGPRDGGGETDVFQLAPTSPARDVVPAPCAAAVDQRDVARPQGAACDAGAFELVPEYALTVEPADAAALVGTPLDFTARLLDFGRPVTGATVRFAVDDGPTRGAAVDLATGADGAATWRYAGSAAGVDTATATFTEAQGRTFSATVRRTWIAPLPPPGGLPDRDADTIADGADNCPDGANLDQADRDRDDLGDVCDTALPPGDLPVVAGEVARVAEVSGTVFVKLPPARGARGLRQASGFVPLKGVATVPVGSIVDARRGRMALATAGARGAQPQRGRFAAAIFAIRQRRRAARIRRARTREERARTRTPSTDLVLRTPPRARRACARTNTPNVGPVKGVVRSFSGSGKGVFRTIAGASVTTTTAGIWLVQDRCGGTVTQVGRGRATVFDTALRRYAVVRAGQAYFARARLFGARARSGRAS